MSRSGVERANHEATAPPHFQYVTFIDGILHICWSNEERNSKPVLQNVVFKNKNEAFLKEKYNNTWNKNSKQRIATRKKIKFVL